MMGLKLLATGLVIALTLSLRTPPSGEAPARGDADASRAESCSVMLGSDVCTWVVLDGAVVTELGATVPLSLIEAVPLDAEMQWPPAPLGSIDLPEEARSGLGLDHMTINWEAHGHPPASFMVQHFDFHFYNISKERVGAIDCADTAKPATLPARYALPDIEVPGMGTLVGLCVPTMGMHAMPSPDVDATEPFEASMMLGYYGGDPIFFEPMVSRGMLLRKADFELPMPKAQGLPPGVRYPTEFRAEYDATADAYRLIFRGFQ
jgi:hypothetical protein